MRQTLTSYIEEAKVLTRGEGNENHVNVFFLPYDRDAGKIYLGHHKKADDWIPPGGHIEPGETPTAAVLREFQEELNITPHEDQLELWNLSYKYIGRPEAGCVGHYDIWYLVHISSQLDFVYDPGEYHAAGWFDIAAGIGKITKNDDFATIITTLLA
jgi:8-oxo-dGTP pyrophosphatase MutT (NUDIX family)